MDEKRRDIRYPARIAARVLRRSETVEYLTNDVCFRGAFIRTDAPPAIRQLVRVAFVLPDGSISGGHAMVVHVVQPSPTGDVVPGMGIQFWGTIENARAWEQFIHDLRQKQRLGQAAARASDKVRRSSERFKLRLDVVLDGRTMTTRDVSHTGMAVRTDLAMPVGTRAQLQLRGGTEEVTLDIVVRRRIDEPGFRGLGVEFVDVSPETRNSIVRLVHSHAPRENVVFVPLNDPKLA